MLQKRHMQEVVSVISVAAAVLCVGGCASRHRPPPQQFSANAPFSRTYSESKDRAFAEHAGKQRGRKQQEDPNRAEHA
jgi:hypothetical protein